MRNIFFSSTLDLPACEQRASKTAGGVTRHYIYDLSGRLIAKHDGADGAVDTEYGAIGDMLLGFIRTGVGFLSLTDHAGRPVMSVKWSNGNVEWDASYRPFGEVLAESGAEAINFRFPGQYYDAETGLHYNYFRTYHPALGRYLESDPIGLRGGWNTYAYVGGNPVMRVDPRGLLYCNYGISSQFLLCTNNAGEMVMLLGDDNVHSGTNEGEYRCRNNNTCQFTKDTGPLPAGDYDIIPPRCSANYPTWVCLEPRSGTEVLDRDLFRIHPGRLSRGCVTISPNAMDVFNTISRWATEDGGGKLHVNP